MWHFTFYIFFWSEAFEIWCVLRTLVTLHSKAPMATIMDSGALDRLQVGTACLWLLPTPCPLHSCICRQDSKHGMGQGVSPHSRLAYQGETSRSVSLNSPKRLPLNMGGLSCTNGWGRVRLFHLLWSKAGRKKVVQESLRETSSCVCFSTGSKYLVSVPSLSLACPWPVANISYRSTIKPKRNLGIVLSTRLQAMTGQWLLASATYLKAGLYIFWEQGGILFSLQGTYVLKWKLSTESVFSLLSCMLQFPPWRGSQSPRCAHRRSCCSCTKSRPWLHEQLLKYLTLELIKPNKKEWNFLKKKWRVRM